MTLGAMQERTVVGAAEALSLIAAMRIEDLAIGACVSWVLTLETEQIMADHATSFA